MKNRKGRIGVIKAIRRLWLFITCDHYNCTIGWCFEDTTEIIICQRCGRILSFSTSGGRRHNPHHDFNQTGDHLDWLALSKPKRKAMCKEARAKYKDPEESNSENITTTETAMV